MYLIIALLLFTLWTAVPHADRPMRAPRRSLSSWNGFVHIKARFFMDYWKMIDTAAKRKKHRRVDIDHQRSKNGTGWAFHWATIGKNKYHDRLNKWHKNTRIDSLTDEEIADRLRGPKGEKPHRISYLLDHANEEGVSVEVELKDVPNEAWLLRLKARRSTEAMLKKGALQFKTLAFLGYPHGAVTRLRPVHEAGYPTILTFTDFGSRKGIDKSEAWPVVDYVRGRAKWVA